MLVLLFALCCLAAWPISRPFVALARHFGLC
jgi:hypothetical protein